MLKKISVVFFLFLFLSPSSIVQNTTVNSKSTPETSSPTSSEYYPQIRRSNYTIENKSVAPYPQIITSDQQASPSNASLLERTLSLNLTVPTIEVTFDLTSSDVFLAIDGASQSFVLRVNYTIYYPNGTLATKSPITTTATSPMHFFMLSPPLGIWRIVASLIDAGDTTAWIQAISYNRGTKYVAELEKEQIHLVAGQNIYLKIPLGASADWFYLYVNKFAGADVAIILYGPSSYDLYYGYYWNFANEFFPATIHSSGVYFLKIINFGSTDIFVEIMRPSGVKFTLNIDQGNTIKCRMKYDLEFFYFTVDQSYDWIALDGAVMDDEVTAEYILINPNLDVIFDDYSLDSSWFVEMPPVANPSIGTYIIAIFGYEYAVATIKVTSSNSLDSIDGVKLDQNWTFAQSGQTFYLKILQSQKYFMFVGTTSSSANVKFTLFSSDLFPEWSWGPWTGVAFYPPTKPIVPFYILKIQGQTNSSTLIHVRFQGQEDQVIETPDLSIYTPRFEGDIIIANLSVRNVRFLFQLAGALSGPNFIALFDRNLDYKWTETFGDHGGEHFSYWRKDYETLPYGNWLQVVIGLTPHYVEISTLQSGDETKYFTTPFQSFETVTWDEQYHWQVRMYKIAVGQCKWFGIVSQDLSLAPAYMYLFIYDPDFIFTDFVEVWSRQLVTRFWSYPKTGVWTIVVMGWQYSNLNPLNCSVSYISDVDFYRDWPLNLTGTITSFPAVVGNETFVITIKSNSTISNFTFKEWNREINFNASGPEATNGFCVVTIPKQVANRPFTVFIDNEPQMGVLSIENNTHTSIYFSYDHSEHEIKITSIGLDTTPPTISNLQQNPLENQIQPNQDVTIQVDATDYQTGVDHVTLYYRTSPDNTTWSNWIDISMNKLDGNTWIGTIPGLEPQTHVQYKVTALDNAQNSATTPIGLYKYYLVVPEFTPIFAVTLLLVTTLFITILAKKKRCITRRES